jgi:hypothetical protein
MVRFVRFEKMPSGSVVNWFPFNKSLQGKKVSPSLPIVTFPNLRLHRPLLLVAHCRNRLLHRQSSGFHYLLIFSHLTLVRSASVHPLKVQYCGSSVSFVSLRVVCSLTRSVMLFWKRVSSSLPVALSRFLSPHLPSVRPRPSSKSTSYRLADRYLPGPKITATIVTTRDMMDAGPNKEPF